MTAPAGSGASPARDGDTRLAEIAADLDIVRREWGDDAQGLLPPDQSVVRLAAEVRRLHTENRELRGPGSWLAEAERTYADAKRGIEAERDTALARLAEVAARHQPYPLDDRTLCRHCGREWPCADAVTAGETG